MPNHTLKWLLVSVYTWCQEKGTALNLWKLVTFSKRPRDPPSGLVFGWEKKKNFLVINESHADSYYRVSAQIKHENKAGCLKLV